VGFVVDKLALGHVFSRALLFSPVNFIPPMLHYMEKRVKKLTIFITGLHNKPQGCGASVASAAGPFTTHTHYITLRYVTSNLVRTTQPRTRETKKNHDNYKKSMFTCQ
jgi:hypothetical protein